MLQAVIHTENTNMDLRKFVLSDSDDDSACFPVFPPPAARVPIEETVETKKVEMREEIPKKGTANMNVFLLQLSALSCKRKTLTNLFICLLLLKSCSASSYLCLFDSFSLLFYFLFALQIDLLSHHLL